MESLFEVVRINDPDDLELVTPKPVPNYDGFYHYPDNDKIAVSENGLVLNIKTGKILKGWLHPSKNIQFVISDPGNKPKNFKLSRLIARTFVGRPSRHLDKSFNDLQVNHIDGNRLNNNKLNLEWVDGKENVIHSRLSGLHPKDKPVLAKCLLTGKEKLFNSAKACADYFGICKPTFWKHLEKGNSGKFHKSFYIFKYDDESEWHISPINTIKELGTGNLARLVTIKNIKTNKIFIVNSIKEAARFSVVKYITLWKKLITNGVFIEEDLEFRLI